MRAKEDKNIFCGGRRTELYKGGLEQTMTNVVRTPKCEQAGFRISLPESLTLNRHGIARRTSWKSNDKGPFRALFPR